MNSYDLRYVNLKSLDEINDSIQDIHPLELKNECIHYKYNDLQFVFKYVKNCNKIVIAFHGAANENTPLPIFRFPHTVKSSPYTFLSIYDNLVEYYKKDKLLLSWFLDTKKYSNHEKYHELIKFILDTFRNNNTKVIFYGTSGGGYACLKYSSIFKATCLISNIQVYLEKYRYYIELNKILKRNNDELIYQNIEELIEQNGHPEKIIYYSNTRDQKHYMPHTIPFVEFLKSKNINLELHIFTGDENATSHHAVQFDTCRKKILIEL